MTPWTITHQAPLSMGFSRQEYWSGLPCPPSGDLSNLGIEPRSPTLQADFFFYCLSHQGNIRIQEWVAYPGASVGEGKGGIFQENSIETCILSRVKQITSPGWMHETSARTWCTGKTQNYNLKPVCLNQKQDGTD